MAKTLYMMKPLEQFAEDRAGGWHSPGKHGETPGQYVWDVFATDLEDAMRYGQTYLWASGSKKSKRWRANANTIIRKLQKYMEPEEGQLRPDVVVQEENDGMGSPALVLYHRIYNLDGSIAGATCELHGLLCQALNETEVCGGTILQPHILSQGDYQAVAKSFGVKYIFEVCHYYHMLPSPSQAERMFFWLDDYCPDMLEMGDARPPILEQTFRLAFQACDFEPPADRVYSYNGHRVRLKFDRYPEAPWGDIHISMALVHADNDPDGEYKQGDVFRQISANLPDKVLNVRWQNQGALKFWANLSEEESGEGWGTEFVSFCFRNNIAKPAGREFGYLKMELLVLPPQLHYSNRP